MMNDTDQENTQLRARCQAAESALRLIIRELDYALSTPRTHGDLAYARGVLVQCRQVLERASGVRESYPAITRPERAQKGASK